MAYCDIGEAGLADMTHFIDSAEASGNWVGGAGPMAMGEGVQPLDLWAADEDAVPRLGDQQWDEWQTVPPSRSPPKPPKRSMPVSPPGPAPRTSGMFDCLAGLDEAPCRTEEQEMAPGELAEVLNPAAPASATEERELAAAIAESRDINIAESEDVNNSPAGGPNLDMQFQRAREPLPLMSREQRQALRDRCALPPRPRQPDEDVDWAGLGNFGDELVEPMAIETGSEVQWTGAAPAIESAIPMQIEASATGCAASPSPRFTSLTPVSQVGVCR